MSYIAHIENIFQDLHFYRTKKVPENHNKFYHFCPWYIEWQLPIFIFTYFLFSSEKIGVPVVVLVASAIYTVIAYLYYSELV